VNGEISAGPVGLEAARALGQRGYEAVLTEASSELGAHAHPSVRLRFSLYEIKSRLMACAW
jgi:flavin-dependent dehydrogenase